MLQAQPGPIGSYGRYPEPKSEGEAAAVAAMFGLPLTVVDVGTSGLERELEILVAAGDAAEDAADEGGSR